jgi:acetyl esterase/lipase
VLQRTPNFAMPANNGPVPESKATAINRDRAAYRESARLSGAGVPIEVPTQSALAVSVEERLATYEDVWNNGGIIDVAVAYIDTMANPAANELLAEFAREKIRAVVDDPETAEMLCPYDYPIGAKRLCVETGYYETFNRDNVRLVDLRRHAIKTITEHGIDLADETLDFDVLVFATGFDAMTGALVNVDIAGRNGLSLKDAWTDGPLTYLGLMVAGFPNLFMVTGPGSPSVLSNMLVSIEQHVEWISDCIADMRDGGFATIEPTPLAVEGWVTHVNDYAALTLYPQANSWYMGANVPGKPRVFLPYCGGVDRYRAVCDEVVDRGYLGFVRRRRDGDVTCADGVVRRVQPDVAILLELMEQSGVPPIDALTPPDARALTTAIDAQRPPGPEVGEIVDATLPGAAGDLRYRLYRPATSGPHPVVAYFHGGGWVLGSEVSDDPICRDLCSGSDTIVVSVDYRHAPESPFPAAVDDAFAAVRWIAANATALGGIERELAVAGWSAGANLAAVVCQLARDNGGPSIAGQLLINPVIDGAMNQPSYSENAEGYLLTKALMEWFWDHYATTDDRRDPRASPLEADSLAGLPPAFIVTSEFDPLRDEGEAYAKALGDAGVAAEQLACRGQIHTSLVAVDLLPSSAGARASMGEAIRGFFR